jgi:hypothetical protein
MRLTHIANTVTRTLVALSTAALIILGLAQSAGAEVPDKWPLFSSCPVNNPETFKCVYTVIYGGEFVLGKRRVALVNPIAIQGGLKAENGAGDNDLIAPTKGSLLGKTSEPLPGGLLGLIPPSSSPTIRKLSAYYYEHNLTNVSSTLELAAPASSLYLNQLDIEIGEGIGFYLLAKIHLESPFLGSSCYIGSDSDPLVIGLTTGPTSPPPLTKPISGIPGFVHLIDEFEIAEVDNQVFAENDWSAPAASGCGGTLAPLLDPIVDVNLGLPSPAGHNALITQVTALQSPVFSVRGHLGL